MLELIFNVIKFLGFVVYLAVATPLLLAYRTTALLFYVTLLMATLLVKVLFQLGLLIASSILFTIRNLPRVFSLVVLGIPYALVSTIYYSSAFLFKQIFIPVALGIFRVLTAIDNKLGNVFSNTCKRIFYAGAKCAAFIDVKLNLLPSRALISIPFFGSRILTGYVRIAREKIENNDNAWLTRVFKSHIGEKVFKGAIQEKEFGMPNTTSHFLRNEIMRANAHAYNNFWLECSLANIIRSDCIEGLLQNEAVLAVWLKDASVNTVKLSSFIGASEASEEGTKISMQLILNLFKRKSIVLPNLLQDSSFLSRVMLVSASKRANKKLAIDLLQIPEYEKYVIENSNELIFYAYTWQRFELIAHLCTIEAIRNKQIFYHADIVTAVNGSDVLNALLKNGYVYAAQDLLTHNEDIRTNVSQNLFCLWLAIEKGYGAIVESLLRIEDIMTLFLSAPRHCLEIALTHDQAHILRLLNSFLAKEDKHIHIQQLSSKTDADIVRKHPFTLLTSALLDDVKSTTSDADALLADARQSTNEPAITNAMVTSANSMKQSANYMQPRIRPLVKSILTQTSTSILSDLLKLAWPMAKLFLRINKKFILLSEHLVTLADMLFGESTKNPSTALAKIISANSKGEVLSEKRLPLLTWYCDGLVKNYKPELTVTDQNTEADNSIEEEISASTIRPGSNRPTPANNA